MRKKVDMIRKGSGQSEKENEKGSGQSQKGSGQSKKEIKEVNRARK